MALQPLGGRVIVQVLDEDEQVLGGIILPESAKEKPTQGKVLAVGPGELKDDGGRVPMPVAVGDTVIYGKYAGTDLKVDGEEVKLLNVHEILAVVEA